MAEVDVSRRAVKVTPDYLDTDVEAASSKKTAKKFRIVSRLTLPPLTAADPRFLRLCPVEILGGRARFSRSFPPGGHCTCTRDEAVGGEMRDGVRSSSHVPLRSGRATDSTPSAPDDWARGGLLDH
jgi:hypothetical protein